MDVVAMTTGFIYSNVTLLCFKMSIRCKNTRDSKFKMQKNDKCYKEFHELLNRVKGNSIEPFQFLNHVLKEVSDEGDIQSSLKRTTYTDIDVII